MNEAQALAAAHAIDHSRSDAHSVSERVIGEVFGWELALGVPAAERAVPAIFSQLLPRYRAGDARTQQFPELAPSPAVDRCLGRLVKVARGELEPTGQAQSRSPLRDLEVRERIIARIHADPELLHRARTLRTIAQRAETELERHYSDLLLEQLGTTPPQREGAPHGPLRLRRLSAYLSAFPYVANYAHLVHAELELLRADVAPLYVRDREEVRLSATGRKAVRYARSRAATLLARSRRSARAVPLRERSFAVCGCGPLPISGLMLHAATDARVTLIDNDPTRAERAAALVGELERLRVLAPDAVSVLVADAAEPSTWPNRPDVVLVASLVPEAAKLRLASALPAANGGKPFAVLFRSAAGLCAELAYEPVPTVQLSSPLLPFCGESVPAHLIAAGLTRTAAAVRGVTAPSSTELVTIAHESVLNTTELYHSLRDDPESEV